MAPRGPATSRSGLTRSELLHRLRVINEACEAGDIKLLRDLGRQPGGYMEMTVRARAWRAALLQSSEAASLSSTETVETVPPHRDATQVHLDVNRSAGSFPSGLRRDYYVEKQKSLERLIIGVLQRHHDLHYYQGYHDVCAVILIVLGMESDTAAVVETLTIKYFRDAMAPTLQPTLSKLPRILAIVERLDPELHTHIQSSEVPPFFALSWVLTWFAHDVDDIRRRARIFDYLLTSGDPDTIIYLCAAVIVQRRQEVLSQPSESDVMHSFLSKLAAGPWDIDAAVALAHSAYIQFPLKDIIVSEEATAQLMALTKRGTRGQVLSSRAWILSSAITVLASVAVVVYGMMAESY